MTNNEAESEADIDRYDQKIFHAYFGIIILQRYGDSVGSDDNAKSRIFLKNYLLQTVSSFCLNSTVADVAWTHNYAFFLASFEHRLYALRIDSIAFVYCLDIGRIPGDSRFVSADDVTATVRNRKMHDFEGTDRRSVVPELEFLKMHHWGPEVVKPNPEKITPPFLICTTSRCCFLVKNNTPDMGPSMYRIFTENTNRTDDDLQVLQLGFREAVVQLCAGNDHVLILTAIGTVYSLGTGSRGELGHGCLQCEQQPRLVDSLLPVRIIQVVCGSWHSIALTDDGDVYVWGWNKCGQLGDDCCALGEILDIPAPLELNEHVVAVAAHRNGTLLRKSDDTIITLGTTTFNCY